MRQSNASERPAFLDTPMGDSQPAVKPRRWLRWPSFVLDLNRSKHRAFLFFSFTGIIVMTIATLVGGYETYHYTESAEFCGTACHPMQSEFVRYEESPHANVDCAHCHIGPGASFFVKAKIDGLKQVYAVMADEYSRPIQGPVHNLRPARETCEECHSPTSYKDNIIKTITHHDNDKANTPLRSTLILKMGGWRESTGVSEGIHWHITNPVYYIAADEQRQVIIWVGTEQPDGTMKEYFARDMLSMAQTSFVEEARANGEIRLMDCIDCHNRTAHYIPQPEKVVDEAIETGLISAELPYIRAKAVELLTPAYPNQAEAFAAINGLTDFYQTSYPNVFATHQAELSDAISHLKETYTDTNFPDMGLNWETNPVNDKHRPTLGCFRCHDDKHVSPDAAGGEPETISVKCNLCHTVPIVGRGDDMLVEAPVIVGNVPESHSDFRWTVDHRSIDKTQEEGCYDCHGQGFCNNGACHNLNHPPDMLYTHAEEIRQTGEQTCYTCHQDILCSRCHAGGIVENP